MQEESPTSDNINRQRHDALDNTVGSTAARHVTPGRFLTFFGPSADDIDRTARVAGDLLSFDADEFTAFNAWKLAPYQNLLWWRIAQQGTEMPITPFKLIEDQTREREPRP